MKRIIVLGISSLLVLSVLSSSLVFAVDDGNVESTVPITTTEKPELTVAEKAKALAERTAKRKADLKTKLTATETARIKSKCKASQGLISSVSGRIKGIETSRGKVYPKTVERLTDLSTKLKNKGADTTTLDESITLLQAKINTFNTHLVEYKQAVSDLTAIDCVAEPDSFKASLDAARTAQQLVSTDAKDIRTHINDVIKPILKTIRASIAPKTDSNTTTDGGQ